MNIRIARPEDAEDLLKIYEYYVLNTAITFEYELPSVEEFAGRIANTLKKYPYLLAEEDGRAIGYAYAGPFKNRAAYDWAVECSIYVDRTLKRKGCGRRLYEELEALLKAQNITNLNACIAYAQVEDEHLQNDSVAFHEHMGYKMVGQFHSCGYKFDRWYDMVWMEKMLAEHKTPAAKVIFKEYK